MAQEQTYETKSLTWITVAAIVAAVSGAALLASSSWLVGGVAIAIAVALGAHGYTWHRRLETVQQFQAVRRAAKEGAYDRARGLLQRLEGSSTAMAASGWFESGWGALMRGQISEATEDFSRALAIPPKAVPYAAVSWRAARTLSLALDGDDERALADIEGVRESLRRGVSNAALFGPASRGIAARVGVAECVIEARNGRGRGALARHATRVRLDGFAPDRALFQGLVRLVGSGAARGPYRLPLRGDLEGAPSTAHVWVGRVLPDAAELVFSRATQPLPEEALTREVLRPGRDTHATRSTWVIWVLAGLMLAAAALQGVQRWAALAALAVFPALLLARRGWRARRMRLDRAAIDLLVGQLALEDAPNDLDTLAQLDPREPANRAAKWAVLASAALRSGRFEDALEYANRGVTAAEWRQTPHELRIELGFARAVALAVRGKAASARGELRELDAVTVADADIDVSRRATIEMLAALAAGDVEEARRFAASTDENKLTGPVALAVDLLLAAGPERAWLREELRESAELRALANAFSAELTAELMRGADSEPTEEEHVEVATSSSRGHAR
ncbi:MAG: hypothetical protein U0414_44370 [Polyangiaceae bacterium]